jgi:hypothetical protein
MCLKQSLQAISPKLLTVGDHKHDQKRIFLSQEKDDNMIESIISKANIGYVGPNVRYFLIVLHTICYVSADLYMFLYFETTDDA